MEFPFNVTVRIAIGHYDVFILLGCSVVDAQKVLDDQDDPQDFLYLFNGEQFPTEIGVYDLECVVDIHTEYGEFGSVLSQFVEFELKGCTRVELSCLRR